MNRRDFLRGAAVAVGGTAIALTAAELWVPRRTIMLPPRGGWPVGLVHQMPGWPYQVDGPAFCSVQSAEWAQMWPQTLAEFNACVEPVRCEFPPGDRRRYRKDPSPVLRELFGYATEPRPEGNLRLDLGWFG